MLCLIPLCTKAIIHISIGCSVLTRRQSCAEIHVHVSMMCRHQLAHFMGEKEGSLWRNSFPAGTASHTELPDTAL